MTLLAQVLPKTRGRGAPPYARGSVGLRSFRRARSVPLEGGLGALSPLTANRYVHVLPRQQRKAASKPRALLSCERLESGLTGHPASLRGWPGFLLEAG